MNTIKFLGAAGTVTGSNFLLKPQHGKGLMVDMGMFQGPDKIHELNYAPLEFNHTEVNAFILTHAHLDHVGRLPVLVKSGYKGPIYMTEPTRVLAEITLLDSAKINSEDKEHEPLYTENDVIKTLSLMEIVQYGQSFNVGAYEATLRDAGHILGSASIEVYDKATKTTIAFSGDLGNSPEDIVKPTEPIQKADYVVMESTYGDRSHSDEDPYMVVQEEINAVEKSGGTLLVPVFSLERSQEILHIIDHLKTNQQVSEEIPVYLDSPMAIKATRVYKQFRSFYGDEMARHSKHDDPFNFPGLHLVEKHKESLTIAEVQGPKVILAGSGMMTGGRVLGHAARLLPQESTRLLIVGFQAEETLGREIIEGKKDVKIDDLTVHINAHVRKSSGMSAHADQPKLLKWIKQIKGAKKVYLIHGENPQRQTLAGLIKSQVGIKDVVMPNINQVESLG